MTKEDRPNFLPLQLPHVCMCNVKFRIDFPTTSFFCLNLALVRHTLHCQLALYFHPTHYTYIYTHIYSSKIMVNPDAMYTIVFRIIAAIIAVCTML